MISFPIISFISVSILIFLLFYQLFRAKKLKDKWEVDINNKQRLEKQVLLLEKKYDDSKANFERISAVQLKDHENIISGYNSEIEKLNLEHEETMSLLEEMWDMFKKSNDMDKTTIMKISSFYSDFILTSHTMSQKYLEQKKNPAVKEALRIKEVIADSKKYIEAYRIMCYKYEYMLRLFPELSDYIDDFESLRELEKLITEPLPSDDLSTYITTKERRFLTELERNQLAFERYLKRRKNNWELGRDYELFCGIELEKEGWVVEYHGIEKKLQDFGRDLIASKGNEILIVQCKYWAQHKIIHEKHIFQLFGSMMEFQINSNGLKVNAMIITSTNLSDAAKRVADHLCIKYIENKPLLNFPRIKCNINKDEFGHSTKIYHMPFDQQYDATRIRNPGECYAWDVHDAEQKGFRRAKRFFGY